MRLAWLSAMVLAGSGCSVAPPGSRGAAVGSADCEYPVTVEGKGWIQYRLDSGPLQRDLGMVVPGTVRRCIDGGTEGESQPTPQPRPIRLRTIQGIPAAQALYWRGGLDDHVYLPGRYDRPFADLPRKVQRLVREG